MYGTSIRKIRHNRLHTRFTRPRIITLQKRAAVFLHICDNGFHALLIWDKNLSVKLFLIPAALQHKTETFTDCIVTDLHAVCVLPDQLRQIHLCDRFTGCDMVQWIFGTLLHHCAIGKRNGIILVNHGKNSSAVGCDLIRL